MYNKDMKSLIKYSLELSINGLRTFEGYKGGDILAFRSSDKDTVVKIKNFCHRLEVTTNIKRLPTKDEYEIFCEFGVDRFAVDDDLEVYDLKD